MSTQLWMVEQWNGMEWIPQPVWASTDIQLCRGTIAGLVKNANYKRRRLRVKLWSRGAGQAPSAASPKGGTE